MTHHTALQDGPESRTAEDVRDRVLEQLLRCSVSLCRAQRDDEARDDLVRQVIEGLDSAIRELRELDPEH